MRNSFTRKKDKKNGGDNWEIDDPDWNDLTPEDARKIDFKDTWTSIESNVSAYEQRKSHRKYILQGGISAVCIIGIMFIWGNPFLKNLGEKEADYVTILNRERIAEKYLLADSSILTLFPGSSIRLAKNYNIAAREMTIFGKADFKVHKDAYKPFIVYSNHLATKAIGTEFVVENESLMKIERVYLKEGIIQINMNKQSLGHILAVKDTLNYNYISNSVAISFYKPKDNSHHTRGITDAHNIKKGDKNDKLVISTPKWYSFDNMSLADLFTLLQKIYDTDIEYEQNNLDKKYFIGRFEKTDSLEHIIKVVTSLNGLDYKKDSKGRYKIYLKE